MFVPLTQCVCLSQYVGLSWRVLLRVDETLMLGKIEGRRRRG